jgi:hypothetical protein
VQSNTPFDSDPLVNVHEGMHVVDSGGREVGRVQYVQMGDPEAVTTAGQDDRPRDDLITTVANAVFPDEREPDVPEPLRSQLRRSGYIKIDGPGLLDTDRYVPSTHVSEVAEDRVRLSVRKEDLAREE